MTNCNQTIQEIVNTIIYWNWNEQGKIKIKTSTTCSTIAYIIKTDGIGWYGIGEQENNYKNIAAGYSGIGLLSVLKKKYIRIGKLINRKEPPSHDCD